MFLPMIRRVFSLVILVVICGCSGNTDGLTKFPVQGSVKVNGETHEGMIVRLFRNGEAKEGRNAGSPVGTTAADGIFRLSTNGQNDGAVVGEYKVTIVWPQSNEPPLLDRLRGAYANAEKSTIIVKVEARKNVLSPIEINVESTEPVGNSSRMPSRE